MCIRPVIGSWEWHFLAGQNKGPEVWKEPGARLGLVCHGDY